MQVQMQVEIFVLEILQAKIPELSRKLDLFRDLFSRLESC